MRFVLGNRLLDLAGGTELHVLTLGEHLQRLGHEVCIYSPQLGPFADYVRDRGIEVVDRTRKLPAACDVVLSQDGIVVYDLADRYGDAVHVFRVCGDVYDFQLPPQLDGVVDLIVVLSDRYDRLARACAAGTPTLRLRVPIDADRLRPVTPIAARPRRAALLGNYPERDATIRRAWERHGVEIRRIGGTEQRYDLSIAMEEVDVVVAKSRAALDAMACGRAVYVFDVFGGDGWVTPANYPLLEADHFAGQATPRVLDVAAIERDLAAYDQAMGPVNRDIVSQHHGARDHAVAFVEAVTEVLAARPAASAAEPGEHQRLPLRELSRLTAAQWSWERIVHGMQGERNALVQRVLQAEQDAAERARVDAGAAQRVAALEARAQEAQERLAAAEASAGAHAARADLLAQELAEASAQAARANARIAAMQATRAWRATVAYWRLRDRLRGGADAPGAD